MLASAFASIARPPNRRHSYEKAPLILNSSAPLKKLRLEYPAPAEMPQSPAEYVPSISAEMELSLDREITIWQSSESPATSSNAISTNFTGASALSSE